MSLRATLALPMSARLSLLVELASLLAREVDLDALLRTVCEKVAEALSAERATIWLVDADAHELASRVAILPERAEGITIPLGRGVAGSVAESGQLVRIDDAQRDARFDPSVDRETGYQTRSMIAAPIREEAASPVRGVLQVLNREGGGAFAEDDERYVSALCLQIGRILALTTLRPEQRGDVGVTRRGPFNRIVGQSEALSGVYDRIARAAGTDATVLLRGETGTGKSLFARAIHVNSKRESAPFVVVDCTTLPAQLVESELFGHERGSFTGAFARSVGRVEAARGGTLFLDEIGDLPLELQGKLLRLVQERSFERVGGRETIAADVRLVAATHRPLEKAIEAGTFRADLYYRLRVVEIEVPALRERGVEERMRLARHFLELHGERYDLPGVKLGADAVRALETHDFPGNVRELEHWDRERPRDHGRGRHHSGVALSDGAGCRSARGRARPAVAARSLARRSVTALRARRARRRRRQQGRSGAPARRLAQHRAARGQGLVGKSGRRPVAQGLGFV